MLQKTEYKKFRKLFKGLALLLPLLLFLLNITPTHAVSSLQMNFSGKIVTGDGFDISFNPPGCIDALGVDTCPFQIKYYDDSGTDPGTLLGKENFLDVELGDYRGYFNLKFGNGTFISGTHTSLKNIFLNEEDVYIEVLFDKDFDGTGSPDFEYTNPDLERFVVSHPPTLERMAVGAAPYSISSRGAIDEFQLKVKTSGTGTSAGLIYFDGGDSVIKTYDGSQWQSLAYESMLGVQWSGTTSNTFFTGNVGIGTETPSGKLDVVAASLTIGLENTVMGATTTNLLTENQSSVETDTTGFTLVGSTITRVTSEKWIGGASLRIVTDNIATDEGFYTTSRDVTASQSYTASVYLKGTGTVKLSLNERTAADADVGSTDSSVVTLSGEWQRASVTRAFGVTGEKARLYVKTSTQQNVTFYADGLQVEQKTSVTPWVLGGQARSSGDIVSMGRLMSLGSGNNIFEGNVGIGTSTPDVKLSVLGDFTVEGQVKLVDGLGVGEGSAVYISASGYLVDGTASSLRYKKNVDSYGSVLSDLNNLELVRFTWNEQTMSSGKRDVGMIAEEVAKYIPELIHYNSFGEVEGLKYDKMGAYAIAGLQELSSEFYSFKNSLENAEEKIYTSSEEMKVGNLVTFDFSVENGIKKFSNTSSPLLGIVSEVLDEERYKVVKYQGSGTYDVLVSRSISEEEVEVEEARVKKLDILKYNAGNGLFLGNGELNTFYNDDISTLNFGYMLEDLNFEETVFTELIPVYLTYNPLNFGSNLLSISSFFTSENGRLTIGNSSINFLGNYAFFGSIETKFLNVSDRVIVYEDPETKEPKIEIVRGEESYDLLEKISTLEERLRELENDEL